MSQTSDNREPARTNVNWGVHGNTSCPPSWRAMNDLPEPNTDSIVICKCCGEGVVELNAHFV